MLAQILKQTLLPPPFYRVEHALLLLLVKKVISGGVGNIKKILKEFIWA